MNRKCKRCGVALADEYTKDLCPFCLSYTGRPLGYL